ncbi:hypothetical protein CDAR_285921 [Caerostris darwini]|uniref:Uncharacterized protein n=1 Tax=Caerostris darwini TaxID=1538125 RepID=A0AAV4VZJ4_9ARAC|nr:hypothetical protein CDAR_285921 [Caerostris darwini]
MLIIFFGNRGIIHREFHSQGSTGTVVFYKSILARPFNRMLHVGTYLLDSGNLRSRTTMHRITSISFSSNCWCEARLCASSTPQPLITRSALLELFFIFQVKIEDGGAAELVGRGD